MISSNPTPNMNRDYLKSDNNRFMTNSIYVFLGIVAILAIATSLFISNNHPKPLVNVITSGGLCYDEESATGKECRNVESIYPDGTYTGHARLSEKEIQELTQLVKFSDISAVVDEDKDRTCSSPNDAPIKYYSFPSTTGEDSYTPCNMTGDMSALPLFEALSTINSK